MFSLRSIPMLAIIICLSGIVLAVAVGFIGMLFGWQTGSLGYLCFAAFQVVAFTVGLQAWKEPLGKAAVIAPAVLLLGLMLFVR